MNLKLKATLGISTVIVASGFVITSFFNSSIMNGFRQLEDAEAAKDSGRVVEAIQAEVETIGAIAADWAKWDAAYTFAQTSNQEFVEENLSYDSLSTIQTDFIAILDTNLQPLFASAVNRSEEQLDVLPPELVKQIASANPLPRLLEQPSGQEGEGGKGSNTLQGFIGYDQKVFMFVAAAITNSSGQGKPMGVICMLREVGEETEKLISARTKVSTKLSNIAPREATAPAGQLVDYRTAFSAPSFTKTSDNISGHVVVRDITGGLLFAVDLSMQREIYAKGLAVKKFLTDTLLAMTALTALLAVALIQGLIVAPVARLGRSLRQISFAEDFSGRVEASRSDELGQLGLDINQTLEALQHAMRRAEQAQHQAESANKAKSSFIAKVSHELRTPIHSITGMLRILLKEERSGAKRNYIMMARNSAYGLLETINEILDFSKVEAGKLVLERIEFSLHDVIRESMQTVGPRIEEQGSLEAVVQVPQGVPSLLYGDPLRLRQVLVNLLGNATKFTKQGHIGLQIATLESTESRILLQLTVFDSGVGIPADRLDHIFEPFGQADESVSRMFTGTGLGLTIVKQFVEGMNGSVRVESELGVGSRFVLTIPFDVPQAATPVVFKPVLASPRVALIDGDSLVVKQFSQELGENGYLPETFRCDEPNTLNGLSRSLNQYGLILVTSEAMKRSWVFDLVVELRGRESTPVVSVLSPFEISVRERLLALEVPFVVTRPLSLLDILGVISGQISLNKEGWEDAEDCSLQSKRPLEVLVADDAQTNRIILTELLREAGHNVVCVENGVDMVTRIRESLEGLPGSHRFDIVLTDVQMPMLDGLRASSQIRELEKALGSSTHLPIVAVTAHAMTDETSRMRSFGVDDVVTKPLDPLRLGQVMQKLTGQQTADTAHSRPTGETASGPTDIQLVELGLRLWTKVAKRDSSVGELFGLSEDPLSPEDFQRVLDIVDVGERSGNSVRRTLLIFSGFLECFRDNIKKLSEAKQSRSVEDLQFAAHALKGLLLDIGARTSGALASTIEQQCNDGDGDSAFASVGQLSKQTLLVARLVSQICEMAAGEGATQQSTHVLERDDEGEHAEQE